VTKDTEQPPPRIARKKASALAASTHSRPMNIWGCYGHSSDYGTPLQHRVVRELRHRRHIRGSKLNASGLPRRIRRKSE